MNASNHTRLGVSLRVASPVQVMLLMLLMLLMPLMASTALATPPASWDWRSSYGPNLVSGVRNQGACGSCYILMPLEMIESRQMIQAYRAGTYIPDIDYSEQYIMSCGNGYFDEFDCGGGYPYDTLVFVRDVGVPYEECYEYTAQDAPCPSACPDSGGEPALHQIPGPVSTHSDFPSETWLMDELVNNGPIAVIMDFYSDFYSYSGLGIYQHITGSYLGRKTMLIVGYGTEEAQDYWIVKNSWGASWGDNGFFKMARGGNDNCNFAQYAYVATVGMPATGVEESHLPSLVRELRVQPNPFNPRTTISFGVPQAGRVSLRVYDLAGRLVRTLLDEEMEATATYEVVWDGRDEHGELVTSGVYLSHLLAPTLESTQKMALIR